MDLPRKALLSHHSLQYTLFVMRSLLICLSKSIKSPPPLNKDSKQRTWTYYEQGNKFLLLLLGKFITPPSPHSAPPR